MGGDRGKPSLSLYDVYCIIKRWRTNLESRSYLKRFAWLSIAAAILTIVLKAAAYFLTGSVGLLSDALESFVNSGGRDHGSGYAIHCQPP